MVVTIFRIFFISFGRRALYKDIIKYCRLKAEISELFLYSTIVYN